MSTNILRSLTRLELFERLDASEQQEVARTVRAYLESHPDDLERLRAAIVPLLATLPAPKENR